MSTPSSYDSRTERVAERLGGLGVDALLIQSPLDLRYLTGFTGSSGLALIAGEDSAAELGGHRFVTDFRYTAQSAEEVSEAFARETVAGELLDALLAMLAGGGGRLGFDEASITVKAHRGLLEKLPEGWTLVACNGVTEELRAVKDAAEVASLRAASAIADEALAGVLEGGLAGHSEREIAIELELRMRRLGAEGPSFPSIIASGSHGALPHAQPRDVVIARDVLVTIDWGAMYDGYCSDCTRTYATGEGISGLHREIYELVLSAQLAGVAAVRAGRNGREVDGVARAIIEAAGHGEHFGHGLGHGVGLNIHEAPRLARTASTDPLLEGNVVTVEPGVYLPGELGVRIEDLLVVGTDAPLVLTGLPKELTVTD
jgi:Xaa-Pro aminopeptidase